MDPELLRLLNLVERGATSQREAAQGDSILEVMRARRTQDRYDRVEPELDASRGDIYGAMFEARSIDDPTIRQAMQGILSHASNLSRFPGFGAVESQEAEELVNTLGLRGLPSDRQKVLNLEPAVESFILGYDADVFKSRHREAERMRARRNETNEARGRARKFAREAEQYRREAALAGRTADQQEQSGLRAFRIGPFNPASILDLFR